MTREKAIEYWEGLRKTFSSQLEQEENHLWRMHLQTTIDALDMAISALRQEEHFRDLTKKVEPLTLNELREMPCEPVYIVAGYVSWWDIVSFAGMEYLYLKVEGSLPFRDYGKNWTA